MSVLGQLHRTSHLGVMPHYNHHFVPHTRQPILTHHKVPYFMRRFYHPEAIPIVLSLAIASACYLGLQKMNRYKSRLVPVTIPLYKSQTKWEGKGYRMGPNEDTMREVLLSIEM
ncbi:hypothetical protein RhiJN_23204 [Ceratobasidium sp. AG-Ba]|nr:hypothetical protein RhiJN_23204 [Ceratobasidium sp. AG-Ba]